MQAVLYEGEKGTSDGWHERKKAFLRQGIVDRDEVIAEHLTEHATIKEFKPGDVIYKKGQRLKLLFFCFYGCVQLAGERGDLDTREPGTDFGGWPFTHPDDFPGYAVTATARDESVVAEVSYSALDRLPEEKLKILKENIDSKNALYVHKNNLEMARLKREKVSLEAKLARLEADKEKGPKKPEPPDIDLEQPDGAKAPYDAEAKAWFDQPLDWTRIEVRQTEKLLCDGYPTNESVLRLAENAGLDPRRLDQRARVEDLMREILKKARQSDRLTQLLAEVLGDPGQEAIHGELGSFIAGYEGIIAAAGMRRKPSIRTLADLPSSMQFLGAGQAEPQPLAKVGFEQIINKAAGTYDSPKFRYQVAEAEVRTARIDIGGRPNGSAFLIGDSLLLTAWHVVQGIGKKWRGVALFDNKWSPTGKGEQDEGRAVAFAPASEWLIAHSKAWDFAIVRLSETVGTQAIGPDRRGCYPLNGDPYDFQEAEDIWIVGHPKGRPVQLSGASPSRVKLTEQSDRVRYKTNTEEGSSGSPVFNRHFRVVAMHHAAGPSVKPDDFNQGIPISAIVTELRKQLADRPELTELRIA